MKCAPGEFQSGVDLARDRRRSTRTTSVYRPVVIELDDFAGFCLVRNLSPNGMMGEVYAELASEQPVLIHFSSENDVTGQMAWSQDLRIGVRFDQDINVNEVLHQLSSRFTGKWINRAPRLQIQCEGVLDIEKRLMPIRVQDISQRGVKVGGAILRPGEEVVVILEDMDAHKAVVRWAQGGTAGLNFFRSVPLEELARWAIRRQSE